MCVAQAAFTEEGLSKLWNELVKDGEIGGSGGEPSNRKEEEEEGQARRSPFTAFLEEWTWGQVCVCWVDSEGKGRGAVLVLCPDPQRKRIWDTNHLNLVTQV